MFIKPKGKNDEVAMLPRRVTNEITNFCFRKMEFIAIFLLIASSAAIGEKNFRIEELGENPGIYFERAEDIYFTKATWQVLIGIDLKNARLNDDYYKKLLRDIGSTCDSSDMPGQCEHLGKTFGHLWD